MARGKIQIKRIENQTNRQVTYSKRRNGLFKKASELTVLCDAKVSIIMISSTEKIHEFISPTTTTKQIYDLYQKNLGIDLWNSHYEKMQETLKQYTELNRNLHKEISHREGEFLDDMGYQEIIDLIDDMEGALNTIRERKYKAISNKIDAARKKKKNEEDINRQMMRLNYDGVLVESEGVYNSVLGFHHGGSRVTALRFPPPNHHASLHSGGGSSLTTFSLLE